MNSAFTAALDLLEALEYHRHTFAPRNWDWIFGVEISWLALAILLTYNTIGIREIDTHRAERLLQINFERYSNDPVSATPMWHLMTKLRDRAHLRCGPNKNGVPTKGLELSMNQSNQAMSGDEWMLDQPDLNDFMSYNDLLVERNLQDMAWLTGSHWPQLQELEKHANYS